MYGFSSALGEKYELGEFIAATRIESLDEDWMGMTMTPAEIERVAAELMAMGYRIFWSGSETERMTDVAAAGEFVLTSTIPL